jgi:hypothetical protein
MNYSQRETHPRLTRHARRRSPLRLYILEILKQNPVLELEDLVRVCSSYTWNEVFLEVDRLSRIGELQLVYKRPGMQSPFQPGRPPSGNQALLGPDNKRRI